MTTISIMRASATTVAYVAGTGRPRGRVRPVGTVPRRGGGTLTRFLALAGSFAVVLLVFFFAVRPWYLQWGATDEEARRPLPGDEVVRNAAGQETRAITIHAGVERVWPWLAQLGQDRGGFYSFDLLENLVGCDMPTDDRLRRDRQSWQVGDKLWMYPPDRAGGAGFATLRSYVPGHALGFGTRAVGTPLSAPEDGSWAFYLDSIDPSTSRLIVRGRGAPGRSLLGVVFDRAIFEPVHFVMERRMMIGVKQLAEGGDRQRVLNHAHVALWTVTFACLVVAAVLVIRRKRWQRPLAGFVAAAALFQLLTLGQPPVMLGAALVAVLCSGRWWAGGSSPARRPAVRGAPARRHRTSPRVLHGQRAGPVSN